MMTPSTVVIWACWAIFGLVWLIGASYSALEGPKVRQRSSPTYAWLPAAVAALALFVVPDADWHWVSLRSSWLTDMGLPILLISTAFALWARLVLGTMWSASPAAKNDHVLHTDGPYAITRHPIYTGMVGMLLGTALAGGLGRWVAVLVLGVVWVEIRIHIEERLLSSVFPNDYPRYRKQVPQLVPGLRRLIGRGQIV